MSDLVTEEYVAAVLIRLAQAQSSDAATDDLTVPLARELGEAQVRIEALEAPHTDRHTPCPKCGHVITHVERKPIVVCVVDEGGGDE